MTLLHSWIFFVGVACIVLVMAGVYVMVRSVIRPILVRTLKDYGTPEAHGLPVTVASLPNDAYGWCAPATDPNAQLAVLLVHGRSRAAGWMYPLATKIWPRATVMAIDLPGHGKSRFSFVSYGKKEARAISNAVDWLVAHQSKPVVVIGVSLGGSAALLAQEYAPSPQVCGLLTIGAFTDIASVFRGVAREMRVPWWLSRHLFSFAGKIGGFDLKHHRPIDRVKEVDVPFLAVQGAHDELVPVDSARRIAEAADRPNCQCAYFNGPHDQPDNDELWAIIDKFLSEREAEVGG